MIVSNIGIGRGLTTMMIASIKKIWRSDMFEVDRTQ